MTISDKIRIYELSRDLNLENKDILDAAQKLSILVKSHSSSISAEDAKKILVANPNVKVMIEGDKILPYGKIVEIMEVLRQSGASGVGLITQPPQG